MSQPLAEWGPVNPKDPKAWSYERPRDWIDALQNFSEDVVDKDEIPGEPDCAARADASNASE
jgi:hypothetical protein